MQVRIYNTLTGTKELLQASKDKPLTMYTCGPTVYDSTHVGHLLPPLIGDVVKRYLQTLGFQVKWAHNFTDVEDKIIQRANKEGVEPKTIAERYIDDYLNVIHELGIDSVDVYPKVSDHLPDIVDMIQGLVDQSFAYPLNGDVYFDVTRFPDYGKLSGRSLDELQAGARVEIDERKHNPADFALWKAAKAGEPSWPSPWGPGRPGWHIECSVMSKQHLGYPIDIHGGGIDLVFPHHENEIAQSEAFAGEEPFVRYWLHNGLLELQAEKMSKSLGNFITARSLLDAHGRHVLRFYLLVHHYRSPREFSEERLAESRRARDRLQSAVNAVRTALNSDPGATSDQAADTRAANAAMDDSAQALLTATELLSQQYDQAMADDFNTAEAIGVLFDGVRAVNRLLAVSRQPLTPTARAALEQINALFERANVVLGILDDGDHSPVINETADVVQSLVNLLLDEREQARQERDWVRADRIRDQLQALGIVIEDGADGPRFYWKR